MVRPCGHGKQHTIPTNGVSRLQTNKYNSTCWPSCHGHALPPSWLKACNPTRNGGALAPRSYTRDEGWPLAVGVQAQAANHLKRLCSQESGREIFPSNSDNTFCTRSVCCVAQGCFANTPMQAGPEACW